MTPTVRIVRRSYGLPKFEKECRLTPELGRMKKAYRVPGTQEAGTYQSLLYQIELSYGPQISSLCMR